MAHPFQAHKQTKVEHDRVKQIAKGYASGGAVHGDAAEDRKMVKSMVKGSALKMDGGKPKGRADRQARARGGRTNSKKGTTNVNVIIAPQGGGDKMPGLTGPMPGGPPPMPPPMMPPPGGPPGLPPGGPPPSIRHDGGRAYASGGAVKSGPAWEEGKRNGTQVSHSGNKMDGKDIGRGKPVTYATGGPVEAPRKMGPKLLGGGRGGLARLEKAARS